MFTSAKYIEDGCIQVVLDGETMTIPDHMGNRHRRMLAEWEAEGNVIQPLVPPIPDSVSARQFKSQLYLDGLLDDVQAWVATQDKTVQIAYENSGTFVRGEPMMQAGFAGLGVTPEQIDDFFLRASQL